MIRCIAPFKRFFLLLAAILFFGCPMVQTGTVQPSGVLGPQSRHGRGEQRVLIAVARFADAASSQTLEGIRKRAVEELDQFVRDQSYGLAWIKADFKGYVTLPDPLSAYTVSPYNFQVDRNRLKKFVEDTMSGLDAAVDFTAYDHILIIPAVHTTPGKGFGFCPFGCGFAAPGLSLFHTKRLQPETMLYVTEFQPSSA